MFSASKTAGPSGYNISRSVRLRSSASAYFSRTLTTPTNNKIWTWSGWVKRGVLGSAQVLLSSDVGTSNTTWLEFGFDAADTFTITAYTSDLNTTSAVFRDPSAWYHVVVAFDTTQATAANRCKIYFNGVQQTLTGAGFTLNAGYGINSAQIHGIGYRNWASGVGRYLDGYMTEINFIDGQALTPSSFGSTNASTGVWQSAKYTGTYGTNGFYLNFSDNSAATAAAIGKDYSGNGNNWTPNNISVTAGVTYDSMIDVPTPYADGGNGRGNYSTLNPLISQATASSNLVSGNLEQNTTLTGTEVYALSTMALPSTGKYYAEISIVAASGVNTSATEIGIVSGPRTSGNNGGRLDQCPSSTVYRADGQKGIDAVFSAYGATWGNGDTIGIAVDMDSASITFYKNNTSQGAITSVDPQDVFIGVCLRVSGGTGYAYANFGQRPFTYTPPSGFKALNTYNLPASTVLNGGKYMAATLYTGTLLSNSITNAGSFKPDLVWVKSRSAATDHKLTDSVRGVTKALVSDSTAAETTDAQGVTAFGTTGFTVGTDTNYNNLSATYVGWQWQAGQGSTSSNTSGSITSTVSVNATAGFSVVTYTAQASGTATIGHGLGVAPAMIFNKQRGTTGSWATYHQSIGAANVVYLNLTNASAASSATWNNTAPTSSVFSLGSGYAGAGTMVAYCWAEIAGFSKFGSYTGNGSTDGPFVYCGFRPRWVMIKRTDSTGYWQVLDTSRSTYNVENATLYPNASLAEDTTNTNLDGLSNGFKIRGTPSTDFNTNGSTYIYGAFAENPFSVALAR